MRNFENHDLLRLLADEEPSFRMLALHFLSEGYARDEGILRHVFAAWNRWGAERAFPEFAMLSFLPVPRELVDECCRRATSLVAGKKLTDRTTRCGGKLIEQVLQLPASDLQTHTETIRALTSKSKIFFRVDMSALQDRVALHGRDADALAQRLESSIESLVLDRNHRQAFHEGLHALETLRREHPAYLNLPAVLAHSPPDAGRQAVGFQLTMHSLIQFEQQGVETDLEKHLLDPRESVRANAAEALVRLGTAGAAESFLRQFHVAERLGQRSLARGLQRIRACGLAEKIAELRSTVTDPALWLMLLVAEVRQLDQLSLHRLAVDLDRVTSFSGALIDALNVFVRVHEAVAGARDIQNAFMSYVQRVSLDIHEKLCEQQQALRRGNRVSRT